MDGTIYQDGKMTAEKLVSIAEKEVGYLEKKSNMSLYDKTANAGYNNYTKYGADYDVWFTYPNFKLNGDAWCAGFVTWCFVNAFGLDGFKKLMFNYHYCPTGESEFKKRGEWLSRNDGGARGDIIFFQNSEGISNHTGIVTGGTALYIYTIEGNTNGGVGVEPNGGGVFVKSYLRTNPAIKGFGRPKYEQPVKIDELRAVPPWYTESQVWVMEKGISDGTRPEEPVTRAEVWTMLQRLSKL